jgi:MSHA biogenesis protein MshJ
MKAEAVLNALRGLPRYIKTLQARERMGLFAAAVAVTMLLWNTGVMQGLEARNTAANASLAALDTGADGAAAVLPEVAAVAELAERAAALEAEVTTNREQLQQRAAGFVEPHEMVALVRDLLQARGGLTLTRLATIDAEQLDAPALASAGDDVSSDATTSGSSDAASRPPAVAYLHGMEVNVEGNFQDLYEYLRALESQRWHLLWRGLELEVGDYPLLRARIKLATVSIDRQWIGI